VAVSYKEFEDLYEEQMEKIRSSKPNPEFTMKEIPDPGPESRLQSKAEKWCRTCGYPYFHDRSRGKNVAGWPDLTVCLPKGRVVFVEFKGKSGRLRKEQAQLHRQLLYLGHEVHTVKSYKRFLEIMEGTCPGG